MPLAVIGPRLLTASHSCGRYAWACLARARMYWSTQIGRASCMPGVQTCALPICDHLVDAAGGHRAAVVDREPQLRPVCLGVPGAGADVLVDAAGGPEADLDGPGLVPLAVDGDLPQLQVDVAVPRVMVVIPDLRQLRQPDSEVPEHSDHRGL